MSRSFGKNWTRAALALGLCVVESARGQGGSQPVATEPPRFIAQLDSIYLIYDPGGDAKAGARAARDFLARTSASYGTGSVEEARSQWLLARILSALGQAADSQADSLVETSLQTLEGRLGSEDPALAPSLELKSILLRDAGQFEASIEVANRALVILERTYGPSAGKLRNCLNTIGIATLRLGKLSESRDYFQRVHDIVLATRGPDHRDTGAIKLNLGSLNFQLANYREARALYEEAFVILERQLGSEHPAIASVMQGLGNVASITGDYEQAARLYARGLELRKKKLGPDHPEVAGDLLNLAIHERHLGDYPAAEQYAREALELYGRIGRGEGIDMANTLGILGDLEWCQLRFDDAERDLERSVALFEQSDARKGTEIGTILANLGKVRRARGDLPDAIAAGDSAVAILSATVGYSDVYVAQAKSLLVLSLLDAGELPRALDLATQAAAAMDSLMPEHPSTSWHHRVVGDVLDRSGQSDAAFAQWQTAEGIARRHVLLSAQGLSEAKALLYQNKQRQPMRRMLVHLAQQPAASQEQVAAAWDAVVRTRGVLLDQSALRTQLVLQSSDPEQSRLLAELTRARSDLSNLYLKAPGADLKQYQTALAETVREKNRLEMALASASSSFSSQHANEQIGLPEVLAALPAQSALVAYVSYDNLREGDSRPAYLAFVCRAGDAPRAVDLGAAAALQAKWQLWREELMAGALAAGPVGRQAEQRYQHAALALRQAVWDPIASTLSGLREIYIVPDGVLFGLNFAALPANDGRYLLQESTVLRLLSTERDLVARPEIEAASGLLALGAPSYDARSGGEGRQRAQNTEDEVGTGILRGTHLECADLDALQFRALPNASAETEALQERWRRARRKGAAQVWTGADASESRLKAAASGHRILHLATHGFFLGDACLRAEADRPEGQIDDGVLQARSDVAAANPLLLSGLALAGANLRRDPHVAADDGILTAEEIATLQLRGSELIVLSACETGLGSVAEGEGVFGLRRALAVAGARNLIMSLWSVEDRSARELMDGFYANYLGRDQSAAESLRSAQLGLLEQRRKQRQSTHPYFWAGFVLTELGRSANSPNSD